MAWQIISNPNEGWKADHQKAAEKSAAWAASGNVDTPDYFEEDGKVTELVLKYLDRFIIFAAQSYFYFFKYMVQLVEPAVRRHCTL